MKELDGEHGTTLAVAARESRRWVARLFPFLAGTALALLLLRQINPLQVLQLLASSDPRWLLAGLGLYLLTNVVRTYRISVLLVLRERAAFHAERTAWLAPLKILPDILAQSLFNNLLPFRSGEASFPLLMYQHHRVALSESTAALVVARIFDVIAIAALYVLFALTSLSNLQGTSSVLVVSIMLLMFAGLVILAAAPWLVRIGLRFAEWLTSRLHLTGRLMTWLLHGGQRAAAALSRMRTPATFGFTFAYSLLAWFGTFGWFAAFMQAIHLPLPLSKIILGAAFAVIANALPLSTLGGFGAQQAGWALGFSLLGMAIDLAIASGFAVEILTLLASVLCGGVALLYIGAASNKHKPRGKKP